MIWDNIKVLVTGGAGFIGQNLVKKLLELKAEVIVLDNFSYGLRINIPSGCKLIEGDIRNKEILEKIPKVEYVFHFAAPSSIILFNNNPQECIDITVSGFLNVLEFSKKNKIKKLIYPSSGSVYGKTSIPQKENDMPQPVNIYGKTKLISEALAKVYSEWVPNIGLRIFAGYGPGEEHKGNFASVVTLFLNAIINNKSPEIYGDGKQKRDFIYIDNIIEAIIKSVEENIENEIINIGSGKAYTFNEVFAMFNLLLGKNIKPIYINKPNNYLENTLADITKMKNLLKVNPLSLEEGLKRYLVSKGYKV